MSLTVTQRPNQFNSWVASGNPIVYKMTRKDFVISAIANSGGALQITVTGNLATLSAALGGPVVAGSKLWFKSDSGVYNALYTVVTCTNAASSVVTFTAGTYISGAGAATGYVNLISNRPIYRVEVELFRQTDNTLIFSKLLNSHNAQGDLLIDVGILNNYVNQEPFDLLTTTGNSLLLPKARRNAGSSLGFYIKYRETWTGSAEAQTDDIANPAWVVKGAKQVGEDAFGGYLKVYSEPNASLTRKFLTKFLNPSIWPGRKFLLSFIEPEILATPRTLVKKIRYNIDNTVRCATYDLLEYTGSLVRGVYESIEDATTPYALIYDKEEGAGTSWTNLGTATPVQVVLTPTSASKGLLFPLQLKLGQPAYSIVVNVTVAGTAGAEVVTPRLEAWTLAGVSRYALNLAAINVGTSDQTWSAIIPATSDTYFIRLMFTNSAGANSRTVTINSVKLVIPVSNKIEYQLVTLTSTLAATETVISETKTCYIKETPDQAYQLVWKNIYGGDSTWVFGFSQDQTYRFQDGKRKRLILFADNITAEDWEALNDLNTTGEMYEPAFNELTSAINKTHARLGAQVYAIDATGNKTGVVVIPTEIKDRTRKIGKSIQITIELPEIQSPR